MLDWNPRGNPDFFRQTHLGLEKGQEQDSPGGIKPVMKESKQVKTGAITIPSHEIFLDRSGQRDMVLLSPCLSKWKLSSIQHNPTRPRKD